MPYYDSLQYKSKARKELVLLYRKETGRLSIPKEKQYWTLCNLQSRKSSSEINQFVSLGFLKKGQFYGVDRLRSHIEKNKKNHPEAHWFHGEWNQVLMSNEAVFNPAVVYLDFTSLAVTESMSQTVRLTMGKSEVDTFLFVNVMLNNPRDPKIHFSEIDFLNKFLGEHFVDPNKWHLYTKFLEYSATGFTLMATYPFRRIK